MHVGRIPELLARRIEGPVARWLVGGDVHLEGRRKRAERVDLTQQLRGQVAGRHQSPEQCGRRGIGGHDPGAKFAPVDRAHALRTAGVHQHLGHRCLGGDLHAKAGSRARDRRGDAAHTAAHEPPTARPLVLAHEVMHEHVCRAGGLRAREGADRGVVREQALDRVVLEPGRQIVVGTLGQQVEHPVGTIADRAMTPQQGGALLEATPAAHRVDRCLEQQLPHDDCGLLEITRELRIDFRVVTREAREFGLGLVDVVTEDDVVVGAQGAEQIVGRQYLQPERVQFQIPDDPWMQQAHHIGKSRGAKSRAELLGHGGATHDLAAFQNEGLQTRLGEVGAADEPVVS